MNSRDHTSQIRIGLGLDGSRRYFVDSSPERLPPVQGRDLERAWYAAREAAIASVWGGPRGFRFTHPDGTTTELALADRDASCWAAAVDSAFSLGTCYGLSLCLRLLALVDLLARSPWAGRLCRLEPDGAELDPQLLRAAATVPLTAEAGFNEAAFRMALGHLSLAASVSPTHVPGARA